MGGISMQVSPLSAKSRCTWASHPWARSHRTYPAASPCQWRATVAMNPFFPAAR